MSKGRSHSPESEPLNLRDFGAVGDGVADDGPAFQSALDALAAAGGGTLFIPEGKYAIATPVEKNFTGLASSITIIGVESLTPVAPPSAPGHELSLGLDLLSEVYPRTGDEQVAIFIRGLRSLVIKDIAFVGTSTVVTDAATTLLLADIEKAQIKHSEFYGSGHDDRRRHRDGNTKRSRNLTVQVSRFYCDQRSLYPRRTEYRVVRDNCLQILLFSITDSVRSSSENRVMQRPFPGSISATLRKRQIFRRDVK